MVALNNTLEGVTPSGTVLTPLVGGNTGGASGNFFDVTQIGTGATLASDSAVLIHGGQTLKIATAATTAQVYCGWAASLTGTQITQVWIRLYAKAANLAQNMRLVGWFNGTTVCGALTLLTTGTIRSTNTGNATVSTGAVAVAANQLFRLEGFLIGSATVGQIEWKLYTDPEGLVPAETITSTAVQNTLNPVTLVRFGQSAGGVANWGPVNFDDVGVSDTGYMGPTWTRPAYQQPRRRIQEARARLLAAAYR